MNALRRQMLDFARRVAQSAAVPLSLAREATRLADHLSPKRRGRKVIALPAMRPPAASTRDVYAEVNARAIAGGDKCECGCGRSLALWGRVMDHWLGGSGRRKQMESAKTCWMLTLKCNAGRTDNEPSAAHWNDAFRRHCAKHGFRFIPHVEHQPVRRKTS